MRALRELARLSGIELAWRGALTGRSEPVSPETLLAVLRALGVAISGPGEAREALRAERNRRAARWLEPVVTVESGAPGHALLRFPDGHVPRIEASLVLEDESQIDLRVQLSAPIGGADGVGGAGGVLRRMVLPALPSGYHQLALDRAGERHAALVIAAPARAYEPNEHATGAWGGRAARAWGVFAPLYALHSRQDWGIGGFGDLERIAAWVGELGGDLVATLPLLASFLDKPFDPSPYAPVSRRFWNEVFLDLEQVPELERSPAARALLASPGHGGERAALAATELVDYRRAYRAKRRVVAELARAFFEGDSPERETFEADRRLRPELDVYARFRAASERELRPWREWPERMRAGLLCSSDYDEEARREHLYAQWRAGRQLEDVAARAKARGVGLYLDFPVGVHADGYDAWHDQEQFAFDAHAGAPPDLLFAGGQDWGFPPLHPERARSAGYRTLVASLRAHCERARALRIDHVMGLHRMYWVPAGASAAQGVYVRYRAEELYAVLCLESARARTWIVGEDLGTVPREVRPAMARHGIQRMYVLQYELTPGRERTADGGSRSIAVPRSRSTAVARSRSATGARSRSTAETRARGAADTRSRGALGRVPRSALAVLNTHDMPPFAAFLAGADLRAQAKLGQIDRRRLEAGLRERTRLVRALIAGLRAHGHLAPKKRDHAHLLRAALGFLAASPARAIVVNLEDLWGETAPQNVPGTSGGPNWRRRLRDSVEEICASPGLRAELTALANARRTTRGRRADSLEASALKRSAGR